ncbi:signal peptidase II [Candidatus Uhrbacteria bacterium]|nr:signal peptidase II [Candidatus Uhrbacteria bacterium]
MRLETKQRLALSALAAAIATVDQISKYAIRAQPAPSWPWPGFLELTHHQNFGLIANTPVPRILILIVTLAVMIALVQRIFLAEKLGINERLALTIILGGALGNFVDRLLQGYVFDWILIFNTSIINIADIAITLGIVGYALIIWRKKK